VKALTVRQPWASLLANGVKVIETRTRPTQYRGRFAIHAGAHAMSRPDPGDEMVGPWRKEDGRTLSRDGQCFDLPLGAIVGSAVLVDCLPIVARSDTPQSSHLLHVTWNEQDRLYRYDRGVAHHGPQNLGHYPVWEPTDLTDQLPLGDFTPGRWAWLIADAKPITERCPVCWGGRGTVTAGLCIDIDGNWWHEPFAASCPGCVPCPACHGNGACAPIPARGRLGWWEWTP
jgi:hypothetical protein